MTEQELENYIVAGNRAIKIGKRNFIAQIRTMFYWKDDENKNIPGVVVQLPKDCVPEPEQDVRFLVVADISELDIPSER